jgi:hypothetical protein
MHPLSLASVGTMCYGIVSKYITDFRDASPTALATATTYVTSATHKQRLATL